MTIVELRRIMLEVCERYRVTEAELRLRPMGRPGRTKEHRYVAMARGVFIVRASEAGLEPRDLAGFLGLSRRAIGYWRTQLMQRGLVTSMAGKVQGERPECNVHRNGRAA